MRILTDVALLGHFVNNFDIMWAIMQLKNITYGLDVALCIALIFCTKYWSLVLWPLCNHILLVFSDNHCYVAEFLVGLFLQFGPSGRGMI